MAIRSIPTQQRPWINPGKTWVYRESEADIAAWDCHLRPYAHLKHLTSFIFAPGWTPKGTILTIGRYRGGTSEPDYLYRMGQ